MVVSLGERGGGLLRGYFSNCLRTCKYLRIKVFLSNSQVHQVLVTGRQTPDNLRAFPAKAQLGTARPFRCLHVAPL